MLCLCYKMKIRKTTLKDVKACHELASKMPELLDAEKEPVPIGWIASFVKEKQIFFVAEEKGKIAGFIMGEIMTGKIALLWLIGVDKNYQDQGVGKKLVESFEEEIKKHGAKAIVLYGFKGNRKTITFWEKNRYIRSSEMIEFLKY